MRQYLMAYEMKRERKQARMASNFCRGGWVAHLPWIPRWGQWVGCGTIPGGGKWFRCGIGKGKTPNHITGLLDGTQGPPEAETMNVQ